MLAQLKSWMAGANRIVILAATPFFGVALVLILMNVVFPRSRTYQDMTAAAASDSRVVAALGAPVRPVFTMLYNYSSGGAYASASFSVRLQGSTTGAWLDGRYFNTDQQMFMRLPNGDRLDDVGIPAFHLYRGPDFTGLYWRADGAVFSVDQAPNGTIKAFLQPLPDDAHGNATTMDAPSIYGTFDLQAGNRISMGDDNCSTDVTFGNGNAVAKQNGPSELCDFSPAAKADGTYLRVTARSDDGPSLAVGGSYARTDGAAFTVQRAASGYDIALMLPRAEPLRMQVDSIEHDGSVRLLHAAGCTLDIVFFEASARIVQRGTAAACGLPDGADATGDYVHAHQRSSRPPRS